MFSTEEDYGYRLVYYRMERGQSGFLAGEKGRPIEKPPSFHSLLFDLTADRMIGSREREKLGVLIWRLWTSRDRISFLSHKGMERGEECFVQPRSPIGVLRQPFCYRRKRHTRFERRCGNTMQEKQRTHAKSRRRMDPQSNIAQWTMKEETCLRARLDCVQWKLTVIIITST